MRAILLITVKMIAMITLTEKAYAIYNSGYPAYKVENIKREDTNIDQKTTYPAYASTEDIKI
ncbi:MULTISPECIES: hypothetical protein [Cysteiniphilum]|uniref:Uncharacterized protein n=1 Tax=Cysteiniphilum litorale TaxID=2056700 RepID=A0A8J2Z401_9GAMM|nr:MULTISPECIES: hypothetical protein [Cysteiniphilum]GGF95974.1 hypothetical protein GCM10010995_11550 [Cysteiniphilum litorale]